MNVSIEDQHLLPANRTLAAAEGPQIDIRRCFLSPSFSSPFHDAGMLVTAFRIRDGPWQGCSIDKAAGIGRVLKDRRHGHSAQLAAHMPLTTSQRQAAAPHGTNYPAASRSSLHRKRPVMTRAFVRCPSRRGRDWFCARG
ncbi:hypothetical protein ACVSQB_42325, partial [Bradyrhizobium elkanii]